MTGSTLAFTPSAEDAGKTVLIKVRANDGEFYSGEVRITIQVGALPVSHSLISPSSAVFDKYSESPDYGDIAVELTLYGNTLTGIYNGLSPLSATDYSVTEGPIIPEQNTSGIPTYTACCEQCAVHPFSVTTVTVHDSYLSTLNPADYTLDFKFSAGSDARWR